MVIAFEVGTTGPSCGSRIVEGNLIDRRTSDDETDVGKWLFGVVVRGSEIWIAEVGARLVDSAIAGGDRAASVVQKRQQIGCVEGSVQRAVRVKGDVVAGIAR